ncbi:MAG: hypothetical protein EGR71_06140 [Clostridiales bacterium]|nr:hypothetical protein [Clostridiales bacterium]
MCMICTVSTYSTSMMITDKSDEKITEAQAALYSYLYVMAYVPSTPTKRSAVTPLIMLVVTCGVRLIASIIFLDSYNVKEIIVLYLGMCILVETVAGIFYLGSCIFKQSSKAMAFGGGLTVWFLIAAILGLFVNKDMVKMSFGADSLNIFNKLTLVGLFDVNSISIIGSGDVKLYKIKFRFSL